MAISICQRLTLELGARGVHFITFNLEKSVRRVLDELAWSRKVVLGSNKIILVWHTFEARIFQMGSLRVFLQDSPFDSEKSHLPPELLISASEASHLVQRPTTPTCPDDSFQLDSVNGPRSSWDEFPNGRFGDYTSPAYGVLDPWDVGGIGLTVSGTYYFKGPF